MRKTSTKSFRFEPRIAHSLSKVTRNKGVNETTYVSRHLDIALKSDMLSRSGESITLEGELFRRIVSSSNPDDLEILGQEFASGFIPNSIEVLQLERDLLSLEVFLSEVIELWGWFRMEVIQKGEYNTLRITHNDGNKWTIFLKSFLTIAIQAFLPSYVCNVDFRVSGEEIKISLAKSSLTFQTLAVPNEYISSN